MKKLLTLLFDKNAPMKILLSVICLPLLTSCGPSQEDKRVTAVTCAVMDETNKFNAAFRVEKINEAREKIGGEPFLSGDDAIKEAFEFGLCQELVLNENYDERLQETKDAWREAKKERERVAAERQAEERRIAAEKRADSNPTIKEEFHPNGQLKRRANYQAKNDGGKLEGPDSYWYENGQLRSEETYKNGERYGPFSGWSENGTLKYEGTYKDGKIDGLHRTYRSNGKLSSETCKSDGEVVNKRNCRE